MSKGTDSHSNTQGYVPFASAQEVWFWFMRSIEARQDGALHSKDHGTENRPCEATDIYKIIHRLHRSRLLMIDHFRILSHYGKRQYAPDFHRDKEKRAYFMWKEAMDVLEGVFIQKGIVKRQLRLVHSEP